MKLALAAGITPSLLLNKPSNHAITSHALQPFVLDRFPFETYCHSFLYCTFISHRLYRSPANARQEQPTYCQSGESAGSGGVALASVVTRKSHWWVGWSGGLSGGLQELLLKRLCTSNHMSCGGDREGVRSAMAGRMGRVTAMKGTITARTMTTLASGGHRYVHVEQIHIPAHRLISSRLVWPSGTLLSASSSQHFSFSS